MDKNSIYACRKELEDSNDLNADLKSSLSEALDELVAYNVLVDSGYARIFPVCPGETVYFVDLDSGNITHQAVVHSIVTEVETAYVFVASDDGQTLQSHAFEEFGKSIFTDYERAQTVCNSIRNQMPEQLAT